MNEIERKLNGIREVKDGLKSVAGELGMDLTGFSFPEYPNEMRKVLGQESTAYYRCVSSDESSSTWSGNLAVLDPVEGYVFSDQVTHGLSYVGFSPEHGKIYNADATVRMRRLYSRPHAIFSDKGPVSVRGRVGKPLSVRFKVGKTGDWSQIKSLSIGCDSGCSGYGEHSFRLISESDSSSEFEFSMNPIRSTFGYSIPVMVSCSLLRTDGKILEGDSVMMELNISPNAEFRISSKTPMDVWCKSGESVNVDFHVEKTGWSEGDSLSVSCDDPISGPVSKVQEDLNHAVFSSLLTPDPLAQGNDYSHEVVFSVSGTMSDGSPVEGVGGNSFTVRIHVEDDPISASFDHADPIEVSSLLGVETDISLEVTRRGPWSEADVLEVECDDPDCRGISRTGGTGLHDTYRMRIVPSSLPESGYLTVPVYAFVSDNGAKRRESDRIMIRIHVEQVPKVMFRDNLASSSSEKVIFADDGTDVSFPIVLVKSDFNELTDHYELSSDIGSISDDDRLIIKDVGGSNNVILANLKVMTWRDGRLTNVDTMRIRVSINPLSFRFFNQDCDVRSIAGAVVEFNPLYFIHGNGSGYGHRLYCGEGEVDGDIIRFKFPSPMKKDVTVRGSCVDYFGNDIGEADEMTVHFDVMPAPKVRFLEDTSPGNPKIVRINLNQSDGIPLELVKEEFEDGIDRICFDTDFGTVSGETLKFDSGHAMSRDFEVSVSVVRNGMKVPCDTLHVHLEIIELSFSFLSRTDRVSGYVNYNIDFNPGYSIAGNFEGYDHEITCSAYGVPLGDTIRFRSERPILTTVRIDGTCIGKDGNPIGKCDSMYVDLEIRKEPPRVVFADRTDAENPRCYSVHSNDPIDLTFNANKSEFNPETDLIRYSIVNYSNGSAKVVECDSTELISSCRLSLFFPASLEHQVSDVVVCATFIRRRIEMSSDYLYLRFDISQEPLVRFISPSPMLVMGRVDETCFSNIFMRKIGFWKNGFKADVTSDDPICKVNGLWEHEIEADCELSIRSWQHIPYDSKRVFHVLARVVDSSGNAVGKDPSDSLEVHFHTDSENPILTFRKELVTVRGLTGKPIEFVPDFVVQNDSVDYDHVISCSELGVVSGNSVVFESDVEIDREIVISGEVYFNGKKIGIGDTMKVHLIIDGTPHIEFVPAHADGTPVEILVDLGCQIDLLLNVNKYNFDELSDTVEFTSSLGRVEKGRLVSDKMMNPGSFDGNVTAFVMRHGIVVSKSVMPIRVVVFPPSVEFDPPKADTVSGDCGKDLVFVPNHSVSHNSGGFKVAFSSDSFLGRSGDESVVFRSDYPVDSKVWVNGYCEDQNGRRIGNGDAMEVHVMISSLATVRFVKRTTPQERLEYDSFVGEQVSIPLEVVTENMGGMDSLRYETDHGSIANGRLFDRGDVPGFLDVKVRAFVMRNGTEEMSSDLLYVRIRVRNSPSFLFDRDSAEVSGLVGERIKFDPLFHVERGNYWTSTRMICEWCDGIEGDSIFFHSGSPVDRKVRITGFCMDNDMNPIGDHDSMEVHVVIAEDSKPSFRFNSRNDSIVGMVGNVIPYCPLYSISGNDDGKYRAKIELSSYFKIMEDKGYFEFRSYYETHELISMRGVAVDSQGNEVGKSDNVIVDLRIMGDKDSLLVEFEESTSELDPIEFVCNRNSLFSHPLSLRKTNFNPSTDSYRIRCPHVNDDKDTMSVMTGEPGVISLTASVDGIRRGRVVCSDTLHVRLKVIEPVEFVFDKDEGIAGGFINTDISFAAPYRILENDAGYGHRIVCTGLGKVSGDSISFRSGSRVKCDCLILGYCVDGNGMMVGKPDTMMAHVDITDLLPKIIISPEQSGDEPLRFEREIDENKVIGVSVKFENKFDYLDREEYLPSNGKYENGAFYPDTSGECKDKPISLTVRVLRKNPDTGIESVVADNSFQALLDVVVPEFSFVGVPPKAIGYTDTEASSSPSYKVKNNRLGRKIKLEASYGVQEGNGLVFRSAVPVKETVSARGVCLRDSGEEVGKDDTTMVDLEIKPGIPVVRMSSYDTTPENPVRIIKARKRGGYLRIGLGLTYENFFPEIDTLSVYPSDGRIENDETLVLDLDRVGTFPVTVTAMIVRTGEYACEVVDTMSIELVIEEAVFKFKNKSEDVEGLVNRNVDCVPSFEIEGEDYQNSYHLSCNSSNAVFEGKSIVFNNSKRTVEDTVVHGTCVDRYGNPIGEGDDVNIHLKILEMPEIVFDSGVDPALPVVIEQESGIPVNTVFSFSRRGFEPGDEFVISPSEGTVE